MKNPYFHLVQIGVSNRIRLYLKNADGQVLLSGQLREMKPMCLDELSLIRKTAPKDSSYDRQVSQDGYYFILRANDGHELGRGNTHLSEELMNDEIEYIKQYAAEAELIDDTPEDVRFRVRDLVVEQSVEVLDDLGFTYG